MSRLRAPAFCLLLVVSIFVVGCGGFNGVVTPTLSSIDPTTVAAGSAGFTLTATGTNFVSGTVILFNGTPLPTTVASATQVTGTVTAAQIATAGTVTVRVMKPDTTTSGSLNLTVTGTGGNSSFNLSSISPSSMAAGSSSFTLTATGIGFVSGATITLNGTAIATTFTSATQLTGTVPASSVASAGTIAVAVTNPDNTTTNSLVLTVTGTTVGPVPTLTSLSPNTSPGGITSPLALTATGTNFVSGSQVIWNGAAMTTTFVSSTKLTASIPARNFVSADVGTADVFVLNPDGTVSNTLPFTITVSASTTPVLTSIFNATTGVTHSQVGDPGFPMTLCGSLFAGGAVAYFGATALQTSAPTAAVSPCPAAATQQVTAQVPASLLTALAEVQVTIQNPSSKASNAIPYYVGMNIYFDESADVVWDARYNLLYVSKPSTSAHNADTVMAFSPKALTDAGAIWIFQLPAGSNPDRLALSSDNKYLYVGLDGNGTVQQLAISGAASAPTAGSTITLGSDPTYGAYYAMDMQVSPLADTTIAVARGVPASSGSSTVARGGVAIYDGTTQRTNTVTPSSATPAPLLDTIQWTPDGNTIYAADNELATGDLYELAVTANGVALPSGNDVPGIFTIPNPYIHLDAASGVIYGDDGLMVTPGTGTATVTGDYLVNGIMTPDASSSTAFFLAHPPDDPNVLEYYVYAYDLTTTAPGADLDLPQVQGIPQHMIRWNNSSNGTSGLAFTTKKFNCLYSPCTVGDGRLYVIDLPL